MKPENSTDNNIRQEHTTEELETSRTLKTNQLLQNAINKIKINVLSYQSDFLANTKRSVLRNIVRKKHLTQTNTITKLFKTRSKLIKINAANLLLQHRKTEIKNKINHISNIFQNHNTHPETTKIHNFTNTKLDTDFINLLNRAANFIPPPFNFSINTFKNTISNEVKETLNKVAFSSNSTLKYTNKIKHPFKKSKLNKKYQPYPSNNPIKTLNSRIGHPTFNPHSIKYIHDTMSLLNDFTHKIIPNNYQPINHKTLNINNQIYFTISKFSNKP